MELEVKVGRGFLPGDENKKPNQAIGVIAIDSLFSPVTRVRYAVENARVGQRTDYDRLLLEIWTDGRISPDDALTQASAILQHHLDVFVGYDKNAVEFEEVVDKQDEEKTKLKKLLNMSVNEIELSVRAANCLNNANITTVGQLAMKTEQEMLKYRNFGKKSLNEIKEKLAGLGLTLGMTFETDLLETPKEDAPPAASNGRAAESPAGCHPHRLPVTIYATPQANRQVGPHRRSTGMRCSPTWFAASSNTNASPPPWPRPKPPGPSPRRWSPSARAAPSMIAASPPPASTRKTPSKSSSTKSPRPKRNAAAATPASSARPAPGRRRPKGHPRMGGLGMAPETSAAEKPAEETKPVETKDEKAEAKARPPRSPRQERSSGPLLKRAEPRAGWPGTVESLDGGDRRGERV